LLTNSYKAIDESKLRWYWGIKGKGKNERERGGKPREGVGRKERTGGKGRE